VSERPLDFDSGADEPEAGARPPAAAPDPVRRARGRNAWLLGVVVFAVLAYVTVNTLRTDAPGSRGVPANTPLPPFAVPLALSTLSGDANVARESDSGAAGKRPACEVRSPQVLNICQLAERGPVVLAILATRGGGRCERQLDSVDRVRRRFPGVQFAAVAIRGDRDRLRSLVKSHHWGFAVGYDQDGAVANVYGVAVCPTLTFAYAGGIVMQTALGLESDAELAARVRRLVAGSRERGWTPPS
jgi:hypothetical protein